MGASSRAREGRWRLAQVLDGAPSLDSAAPYPVCPPACQHLESLIRVEDQSLFLNGIPVVVPRCFLSAPEHRSSYPFPSSTPNRGGEGSEGAQVQRERVASVSRAEQNQDCCGPTLIITLLYPVYWHCQSGWLPLTISWPWQICHHSLENVPFPFLCLCWCQALHLRKSDWWLVMFSGSSRQEAAVCKQSKWQPRRPG